MKFLLPVAIVLSACGAVTAKRENFEDLPDKVKNKFKKDKFVKKNYKKLFVQSTGGEIITRCDKKINLKNLKKFDMLTDKHVCEVDGQVVSCPPSNTYTKTEYDGTKVTVFIDTNVFGEPGAQRIRMIQVIDPDPGCDTIEVFEEVEPGKVTSIPPDAYDDVALSKYVLEDAIIPPGIRSRNLRGKNSTEAASPMDFLSGRKLQSCSAGGPIQKVVKLGLAIDSAFCNNDEAGAITNLLNIVTMVKDKYEQYACMTIEVATTIKAFCDQGNDPFRYTGSGDVPCGTLLDSFRIYWNNNFRNEIDSNLHHLTSGQEIASSTIGCAYSLNNLPCLSVYEQYTCGVNQLDWTNSGNLRAALLAHEMGHNLGADHDDPNAQDTKDNSYIMEGCANCDGGAGVDGFSNASRAAFDILFAPTSCLDDFVASTPTDSPTTSPTTTPTASPTETPANPDPTSSPTVSPTAWPTASPAESPTGSPTSSPTTAEPTGSPTSSPTTAKPTQSPTASPTTSPTASPTASPTGTGGGGPTGNFMESLVANIGGSFTTVNFANTYTSPVAVCSVRYVTHGFPLVVRMQNAGSASMEIRLQNPGDGQTPVPTREVNCLVIEEGIWQVGGTAIEAKKYQSSALSYKNSWNGETQSYGRSYNSPIVLGQVMSENDTKWSVFWCSSDDRRNPPDSSVLKTGYHIGEDTNRNRDPEILGHIVIEPGHVGSGTSEFEAGLTGDSIRGIDNNNSGYTSPYSQAFPSTPEVLIATQAAMDGNDGGWAVLYEDNDNFQTAASIRLAIDEDQIPETERRHTTEQVAYLAFASEESFTMESPSGPS